MTTTMEPPITAIGKVVMKIKLISILIFFSILSSSASSKEITDESFNGKWCGKWDGIYEFCLVINDLNSDAKYMWKEHTNGKFKKNGKTIVRKNTNTLQIENIWFVLDENNLEQAKSIGVFTVRCRVATLEKRED